MSTAAVPNGRLRPPQRRSRSRLASRSAASRQHHTTEAGLLLPPPSRSLDQCPSAEELWLRFKKPKVPPARIPRRKPLLSSAGTTAAAAAATAATAAANGQLRPPSVLAPLRATPAVAAAPGAAAGNGDGDAHPPSTPSLRGAAAEAAAHAANDAAGGAPSTAPAAAAVAAAASPLPPPPAGGGGGGGGGGAPPSDTQGLRDLRRRFAAHSGDVSGRLTWAQLQAVGAEVGACPEQRAFRRADKEKAGSVELQDALRVLYPRARAADVRWVVRHWDSEGVAAGDEHHSAHGGERGKAAAAAEVARHLAAMPLDALYELQCIFNLYRGGGAEGGRDGGRGGAGGQEGCVTKEQLLAVFAHTPHITAADVSAFVVRYSASKRYLTFPEFAMLMEHCVATDGVRAASSIRYSFTQKPQPMPEL